MLNWSDRGKIGFGRSERLLGLYRRTAMKYLSLTVTGLGVLALILANVGLCLGHSAIMGVRPGGLVQGASALFLLALVIMAYGRCYCCNTPPPAKP